MADLYNRNLKRLFWYLLAGMRGGPTRIKMIKLILQRPYNINQLRKKLSLDYKTVQHHVKVLEENRIISSEEKKYGKIYFTTQLFEQNKEIFDEMCKQIKEE